MLQNDLGQWLGAVLGQLARLPHLQLQTLQKLYDRYGCDDYQPYDNQRSLFLQSPWISHQYHQPGHQTLHKKQSYLVLLPHLCL